jgi:F-type H+-transporting ATPase subunit alpha
MVATLNQPQYKPWPMEEQVVAIYAGINGYLDDVPVEDVPRFQDELNKALEEFGKTFAATGRTAAA